jgi:hypothetical protein
MNKITRKRAKNKEIIIHKEYADIELSNWYFSKIDIEDIDTISKYSWSISTSLYARNRTLWMMHRFIMNCPNWMYIDHINNDKLDNRKSNLRVCTHQENDMNRRSRISSTSKYKWVYFYRAYKKWSVNITYKWKRIHIGYFKNEDEAGMAYDKKAKELFWEYAYLNIK